MEFDPWGEGWEFESAVDLLHAANEYESFYQALGFSVREVPDDEEDTSWFEEIFVYIWQLRRLFWAELLRSGQIRVRFLHSGEHGKGIGPITLIRNTNQSQVPDTVGVWPDGDSVVISTTWHEYSDQLYMLFIQAKSLFSPGFEVHNLSTEEHDSDLYEYSFTSVDEIRPAEAAYEPTWGKLTEAEQSQILGNLFALAAAQDDAFSEVWLSPMDVIAMIVAHPETKQGVISADLLQGEPELASLRPATKPHNETLSASASGNLAVFCGQCGNKFETETAKFCGNCGSGR